MTYYFKCKVCTVHICKNVIFILVLNGRVRTSNSEHHLQLNGGRQVSHFSLFVSPN